MSEDRRPRLSGAGLAPSQAKSGAGASTNQELTPRALILVATPGRTEVDRRAGREKELERGEGLFYYLLQDYTAMQATCMTHAGTRAYSWRFGPVGRWVLLVRAERRGKEWKGGSEISTVVAL